MNDKKELNFLPFNAINEFMRAEFRLKVIKTALLGLSDIDRRFSAPVDRLTKKYVKAPGFRNSVKAPATVKSVAMVKPFGDRADLVGAVLNAWAETKFELREQIYRVMTARGWKLLPLETNRAKLPGFLTEWPEEDDYDVLYDAYIEANPEGEASVDETSLMAIWLAGRLPVEKTARAEIEFIEVKPEEDDSEE